MRGRDFLRDKLPQMAILLFVTLFLCGILYAYRLNALGILFVAACILLGAAAGYWIEYARRRGFYRNLLEGRRVSKKRYDYSHHCRADVPGEYLEPHDVIIVKGIHAFYDARLRAMMDLKLYMHVESDICLLRRIQRDINERGRQIDNISSQYITTVKPMFDQYIRNYEQYADVIVAGGGKDAKITEILAGYINNDLHLYRGLNRRRDEKNA